MEVQKYTTIDRVFSKIYRDLKDTDLNEDDVIEWIGESLEFLKVPQVLIEDVILLKVEDYHSCLPDNLHQITQIARNNRWEDSQKEFVEVVEEEEVDENFLDLDWTYTVWTTSDLYKKDFTPVRLSERTFFKSVVLEETNKSIYGESCRDEYTVVGTVDKRLRFSFREGEVALSCLMNTVDKETGYPLIPDDISYLTAVNYYIKWKVAEHHAWSGRDGWESKADKAESKWLKYVKQAKSKKKMPSSLDQHQNMLENTHKLLPNHYKYKNFFNKR